MRRYKKLFTVAIICLLLAGVMFYFNNIKLPEVAKATEMKVRREIDVNVIPKTRIAIIADKNGISKYTELTQKVVNEKVKFIEVPTKYVAKGAITDLDYMTGKITKEDLRFGEQVVIDSLSGDKKWFGEYQRLKEYSVSSIVADEVKSGNIIDLLVSYGDGTYDVVVSKLKVIKLITESQGQQIKESPETTGGETQIGSADQVHKYTLILAIDEGQYRDLELAKTLGKLETRLYLDESQPASVKTFNYTFQINKTKALNKVGG